MGGFGQGVMAWAGAAEGVPGACRLDISAMAIFKLEPMYHGYLY